MQMIPAFCALGIWRLTIIGIGNTSKIISVTIFRMAVAMNRGVLSMQLPAVIVISQPLSKGRHEKIKGNTNAILYPMTRNILA